MEYENNWKFYQEGGEIFNYHNVKFVLAWIIKFFRNYWIVGRISSSIKKYDNVLVYPKTQLVKTKDYYLLYLHVSFVYFVYSSCLYEFLFFSEYKSQLPFEGIHNRLLSCYSIISMYNKWLFIIIFSFSKGRNRPGPLNVINMR